jgi:hypothetical protein
MCGNMQALCGLKRVENEFCLVRAWILENYNGPGFYWIVIIIWLLFGLHLFFGRLEKLIVGCLFGVGGWLFVWACLVGS